ncbi:Asp-tRNA(Asn)/Glu-tRNA(Gln) amidotransferase subunit GatB [Candidatus Saccharibacteria bacterium]|nr:Asp-tRNA(Asn)/Glu-tRNA(Gln) amidotransferase subunit GatB [Candidatus Saccharibacteria bacterium]
MSKQYTPTIGVEIHVQLATKSKMFCACNNDSRQAEPNTNVCPVCLGLPGTLPVINKGAVEKAIILGTGLNAKVATNTSFDRKNYFYPDSPKGYQITQMDEPIVQSGYVEILVGDEFKKVGVHHAHLEEDAGKLTHPAGADYSLVDFNRAGTPLVEIVSEPDMHSPEEAKRYLQEVYNITTTLGVSDGDMQHGNFKFDLNVSVSSDDNLGTKVELKNLNSFRNAERALTYEIKRQVELLEHSQAVEQETRGWNDGKAKTFSQRSKEEANDYRYFPEPDLPPLVLTGEIVEPIQSQLAGQAMPIEVRKQLKDLGLNIDEQDVLIGQAKTRDIFFSASTTLNDQKLTKKAVNWLVGDYQAWIKENDISESKLTGANLANLIKEVDNGTINNTKAKELFVEVVSNGKPLEIKTSDLIDVSDLELEVVAQKIVAENPKAVEDFRSGNQKALGFFLGALMRETRGQANPTKANQIMLKLLKGD